MLENVIVIGFLLSPILFILLFIICALKISSMCSRIEELENMQEIMFDGDEDE